MAAKSMTANVSESTDTSWWGAFILGAVFVLAGVIVLGDVVLATAISAILIGFLLLMAGASEIFQAFSAQYWRGFFLRLLTGALYCVCGVMLVTDPTGASVILTLLFSVALIASGVVRIFQAFQYWQWSGALLLLSGLIGIAAGLVLLSKWPVSGLWVLGLLVGIDLLLHGFWWISLGVRLRQERHAITT